MSRIFVGVVIAVVLFGGVFAADQALTNPELEPSTTDADTDQQTFAETAAPFIEVGGPIALFGLVAGTALAAISILRGG